MKDNEHPFQPSEKQNGTQHLELYYSTLKTVRIKTYKQKNI